MGGIPVIDTCTDCWAYKLAGAATASIPASRKSESIFLIMAVMIQLVGCDNIIFRSG